MSFVLEEEISSNWKGEFANKVSRYFELENLSNGKGNKTENKFSRIFVKQPDMFQVWCEILATKDCALPFWVYFSYRVSSWPKNETTGLHACLHSTAAPASSVLRLHSISARHCRCFHYWCCYPVRVINWLVTQWRKFHLGVKHDFRSSFCTRLHKFFLKTASVGSNLLTGKRSRINWREDNGCATRRCVPDSSRHVSLHFRLEILWKMVKIKSTFGNLHIL